MERLLHEKAKLLVCDGQKALFIQNDGWPGQPIFKVVHEMHWDESQHTADLGTDKPGRVRSMLGGPISSIEPADWHAEEEDAFVKKALQEFTKLCEKDKTREVVFVAPPKALAVIRKAASKALMERVVGQLDKDLTKHPIYEIERLVTL